MRADILKKVLDSTKVIHTGTDAYDALTVEEKIIWSLVEEISSKASATAFNAVMDARYGKQPTGGGAELTDGEDSVYQVSFRGVQNELE